MRLIREAGAREVGTIVRLIREAGAREVGTIVRLMIEAGGMEVGNHREAHERGWRYGGRQPSLGGL